MSQGLYVAAAAAAGKTSQTVDTRPKVLISSNFIRCLAKSATSIKQIFISWMNLDKKKKSETTQKK